MKDPVNILIVDDRPENLLALESVLEPLEERVVRARSGEEALRLVLREDFAVILLDVRMPGMDGLEVAQLVRQRPRNSDTPIIFITGDDRAGLDMDRGYEAGAVDYIVKPFVPAILRSKVSVFTQLRRKSMEIERQAREIHEMRETQRYEEARRESERRFRLMADAAPVLMWVAGPDGRFLYVNAGWTTFTGRSDADEIGEGWLSGVHPEDRGSVSAALEAALRGPGRVELEFRLRRHDGTWRWLLCHALPRFEPDGTPAGLVGSCVDFTERIRMEEQLAELNRTLEERVAQRTAEAERRAELLRILASELTHAEQRERRRVAHMLHDHLQQILVAALMRLDSLLPRLGEAPHLETELTRLRGLLQQSVDTSRSLTVELSPPILYDGGLAPALRWLGRSMGEKHGLAVECDFEFPVEPTAEHYGVLVFQAVRELLFNVIKHSGAQTARLVGRSGDGWLRLTVVDDGRGFEPDEVPRRPSAEETSFGLFSIRERLEVLNGALEIESQPGEGSRVTVVVPLDAAAGGAEEGAGERMDGAAELPAAPEAAAGRPRRPRRRRRRPGERIRVLLADDHKILREGLAGLLREQADLEVIGEASDGATAIEMTRNLQPDVIVMDISMPGINGVEATRRIVRESPATRIVGLSMHEVEDMGPALVSAGAETCLSKDGASETLVRAIRGAAGLPPEPPLPGGPRRPEAPEPLAEARAEG